MKISIITACYNSSDTILGTIQSINNQTYNDIEHVIIDGNSSDNTLDIAKYYCQRSPIIFSETDKGIYDALNKGLDRATGDIIGFLNSDDVFTNENIVKEIICNFINNDIDGCYGNLIVFQSKYPNKTFRYYDSSAFSPKKIAYGYMPAHPTLYCKKEVYNRIGKFKTDYKIAADFEFVARLFADKNIRIKYIDKTLVRMRKGGISSKNILSNITLNKEIYRACRENHIDTNYIKIYSKYFSKILGLIENNC
jgi:glycosyltransferase involved in cell wall biosynthesis